MGESVFHVLHVFTRVQSELQLNILQTRGSSAAQTSRQHSHHTDRTVTVSWEWRRCEAEGCCDLLTRGQNNRKSGEELQPTHIYVLKTLFLSWLYISIACVCYQQFAVLVQQAVVLHRQILRLFLHRTNVTVRLLQRCKTSARRLIHKHNVSRCVQLNVEA